MNVELTLRDFSIGYGERTLLREVNTRFERGMLTALIGRNGAGKSTLLRALAGLNTHYRGDIEIGDRPLRSMSATDRAKSLALVTTERTRISRLRCRDVVAMGRAPYTGWTGRLSGSDLQAVESALEDVGMADYAERTMDTMSDGECQRIMIARAIAQDTPVLLLDEPTSFLDMPNRYQLAALLGRLARDHDKCIIFSTHELDIADRMCDRIALVDCGNLINVPPAELDLRKIFGIPQ